MSVRRISAAFQASVRPPDEHWFKAAGEDDVETVASLLASRVDPNGIDKTGNTALHLAAYKGAVEVVKFLMRTSTDVNKRNKESLSPFLMAASAGHDFIVEIFLQDVRVDKFVTDEEGATALHLAATAYNAETVEMLMKAAISPDIRDEHGFTPLMYAARAGQIFTVAALLDAGSDPQARSQSGLSAVGLAEKFGHSSVVAFIKKLLPKPPAPQIQSPEVSIREVVDQAIAVDEVPLDAPVPLEVLHATSDDAPYKTLDLSSLVALLREFHASEENRSPEFADQVKGRLDEAFEELADDGKISRHILLKHIPGIPEALVNSESVDKRTFAVILTALATLPDN